MQIVLSRQDLLGALKRVGAAVDPGNLLSIRQSVLIIADENLTFGTSDGPLGIIVKLTHSEIKKAGGALLNHRRLAAIINELPTGSVEISVDAKFRTTIKSSESKRKFTMTSLDPKEFPPLLSEKPGEPLFAIEAKVLQQASGEIQFGIDKAYTDGALLTPDPTGLKFSLMSLSSRALAVATGWFTKVVEARDECLLPRNLLDAIDNLTADETDLVLSMDEQKIFVSTADTLIIASRLQNAPSTVWRQLLAGAPKEKRFRVQSDRFLESVRAVSVAADIVEGNERFIQIDLMYQSGQCTVSTRKSERSFGEDDLAITEPSDTRFEISMDAQVLSQALRSFAPTEFDLYVDIVHGQEAICLKSESLTILMSVLTVMKTKEKSGG